MITILWDTLNILTFSLYLNILFQFRSNFRFRVKRIFCFWTFFGWTSKTGPHWNSDKNSFSFSSSNIKYVSSSILPIILLSLYFIINIIIFIPVRWTVIICEHFSLQHFITRYSFKKIFTTKKVYQHLICTRRENKYNKFIWYKKKKKKTCNACKIKP